MLSFYSDSYSFLAVYPDTEPDMTGTITLNSAEGSVKKACRRRTCIVFPLRKNMAYTLYAENATVELAYLFSENDSENGIVFPDAGREESGADVYHFSSSHLPLLGLSAVFFFEGSFHLFYLSSPFQKADENRYLCHAKSQDLLSWKHLPILLEPWPELCLTRHRTGGIFGGCAEEKDGIIKLYFTRRIVERKTGKILSAFQSAVESRDLLHFSPEKTVIKDVPTKVGPDVRDPFVFSENGVRYMVQGGTALEKGAVLLYKETTEGWQYMSLLYKSAGSDRIDFPSAFRLGRTFVLLCTLQGFTDKDGTPSPAYLFHGSFREGICRIKSRERLDFGGDFYAPRTVLDGKRRLIFGTSGENGGSLLIRELSRKNGIFYVKPVEEMYAVLGEETCWKIENTVSFYPKSSFLYVRLCFDGNAPFRLRLGRNGEETLSFSGDGQSCGFLVGTSSGEKFHDAGIRPCEIEIFADSETVSVFINGGIAAGTKRFLRTDNGIKAEFTDVKKVKSLVFREGKPGKNRFS
ncbi:MAG: hypothetical protein IJN74_01130 [Clostridia bacterium]|nr:hypothetical protein [Clostridia bacterium]